MPGGFTLGFAMHLVHDLQLSTLVQFSMIFGTKLVPCLHYKHALSCVSLCCMLLFNLVVTGELVGLSVCRDVWLLRDNGMDIKPIAGEVYLEILKKTGCRHACCSIVHRSQWMRMRYIVCGFTDWTQSFVFHVVFRNFRHYWLIGRSNIQLVKNCSIYTLLKVISWGTQPCPNWTGGLPAKIGT